MAGGQDSVQVRNRSRISGLGERVGKTVLRRRGIGKGVPASLSPTWKRAAVNFAGSSFVPTRVEMEGCAKRRVNAGPG